MDEAMVEIIQQYEAQLLTFFIVGLMTIYIVYLSGQGPKH